MARTGLYQADVRKARDALLAQGRRPSVDAVRVELGNTGSKTTIHKYLKELESEESDVGPRTASISDSLQDLVERLAARLHEEADARVAVIIAEGEETEKQQARSAQQLQLELVSLRERGCDLELQLGIERNGHDASKARLQAESITRHTAEQQVADLKDRLAENEGHRKSLEEKHTHARDALDHYRQSVKDQRDQDLRRHEQQIQHMQAELRQQRQALTAKQEEGTRLNQEGAKLVAELSHTKQSLYEQLTLGRKHEQKIELLQSQQLRAGDFERQLATKEAQTTILSEQLVAISAELELSTGHVRELELSLARAEARAQIHEGIGDQFRAYLDAATRSSVVASPGA